jgi:hypothetical protein
MNDIEYFRNGPKESDGQLEIRLKINEKTGITTVEEYYRDHRHHRDGHRPTSLEMQLQA